MASRKARYSSKYSSLSYKPLEEIEAVIKQRELDVAAATRQVERAQAEVTRLSTLHGERSKLQAERDKLISTERKAQGVVGGLLNLTRLGLSADVSAEVKRFDHEIMILSQELNFGVGETYPRAQFRLDDAKKTLERDLRGSVP